MCNLPVAGQLCDAYGGTKQAVSFATDPFGYVADKVKDAVAMVLKWFARVVDKTSTVNWSDPGFLRTYTMMFGLATFVTAILWLVGVGKRVVAGVAPAEAIGESIGYLLISVVVTAFAPAAVALVTDLVDEMAAAMFRPVLGDVTELEGTIVKVFALFAGMAGGQLFITIFGLFLLFAIVAVWVELVIRSALIYLALVFGPLSFSGLVDRALWAHTKRWLGIMLAIIGSKLVTLTVLALATGMLRTFKLTQTVSDPIQAFQVLFLVTALFFLAFLLPMAIAKFVPVFGDELATIASARRDAHEKMREGAPAAKSAAEEMASGTAGRLGKAGDAVDKGTEKVEGLDQSTKKPTKTPTGKDDTGQGDTAETTTTLDTPDTPDPTGAGEATDAVGATGGAEAGGAGAAEGAATAGASGAAGPAAAAFAVKEAADQVIDTAEQAVDSGTERATGADPGMSDGGSGGGGGGEPPPEPQRPPAS